MNLQSLQAELMERYGPEGAKNFFYLMQIGLLVLIVGIGSLLRPKSKASGFAVREADLRKAQPPFVKSPTLRQPNALANAKMETRRPPLLEGISISGPPHEVLGVAVGASPEEIQRAYKERMKRYHPDIVGRQGTREWNEAQQIATAIQNARDELLKRHKAKS